MACSPISLRCGWPPNKRCLPRAGVESKSSSLDAGWVEDAGATRLHSAPENSGRRAQRLRIGSIWIGAHLPLKFSSEASLSPIGERTTGATIWFSAQVQVHGLLGRAARFLAGSRGSLRVVRDCVVEIYMFGIPRRFSHFVFGFIQSGLTCAVAAAIASFPFLAGGTFLMHWLQSWLFAWITMLPIVFFAAPAIRSLTHVLTRED
jgi:uncharacterized protein DUF2798